VYRICVPCADIKMTMLSRFFLLSLLFLALSCQSDTDKKTVQTSEQICNCYQSLIEVNAELMDLLESGKSKSAEALFPKVAAQNKAAVKCTKDKVKQLGKNASLNPEILQQELDEKCPNVWEQVESFLFEE